MIAKLNRDPKKSRPLKPSDYDPYLSSCLPPVGRQATGRQAFGREPGEVIEVDRENIATLKQAFMKNHRTDGPVTTEGEPIQSR